MSAFYLCQAMREAVAMSGQSLLVMLLICSPLCNRLLRADAGLEYGDYRTRAASYGERLRDAATYVSQPSSLALAVLNFCCL